MCESETHLNPSKSIPSRKGYDDGLCYSSPSDWGPPKKNYSIVVLGVLLSSLLSAFGNKEANNLTF